MTPSAPREHDNTTQRSQVSRLWPLLLFIVSFFCVQCSVAVSRAKCPSLISISTTTSYRTRRLDGRCRKAPMEEQQQQQQQQHQQRRRRQRTYHPSILGGIVYVSLVGNPSFREERQHKLSVFGEDMPPIDRHSWQHLVDFLDGGSVVASDSSSSHAVVTDLEMMHVELPDPPDGSLDVLRSFFARSDTPLTKVKLWYCDFGSHENASRLLSAFETNRTITDFAIQFVHNLEDAALGRCVSGMLENMPQLQRLSCERGFSSADGIRALQPGLRASIHLKELNLYWCIIGDEGIRLLADAPVGNTTMDALDIQYNGLSFRGLAEITRLFESTQLKTIHFAEVISDNLFGSENTNQQFVAKLIKNTTIEELPGINTQAIWRQQQQGLIATTINICARNKSLNHVNLLLVPLQLPTTTTQQPHPPPNNNNITTCHKAIAKFAMIPDKAGASAIFTLFIARPQLLEKRLRRPVTAAVSQAEQKRRRL